MHKKLTSLVLLGLAVIGVSIIGETAYALCGVPSVTGVSVEMQSSLTQTVASAAVGYTATVHNKSTASYDGAALAVEVRDASSSRIVDRFVVPALSVPVNADAKTNFVWRAGVGLTPGTYVVGTTFIPQGVGYGNAYASAGLPHAESRIAVVSGAKPSVAFSGPIAAGTAAQGVSPAGSIMIPVSNVSALPFRGTVTWKVYSSEGTVGAEPLVQEKQEVEMLPHGTAVARYVVPHGENGSFYVEAVLSANDAPVSVASTWLVKNVIAETDTACGTGSSVSTGSLAQIGILMLVIIALVLGWGYMHKMQGRGGSEGSL